MVDVDGVLVNGRPRDGRHLFADLERDLGIPLERLQAEFFKPHWEAIVTGRAALMERLVPVLARLAPALPAERFVAYWFENDSRLDHEVLEALHDFRRDGVRVFLATNQEHLRARYLMETLGLAAEVDGICYSAALGDRKPGAAFFRLAAAGAAAKPAEIAFVNDAEANVDAARKAGWAAVRWTSSDGGFRAAVEPLLG
jgi:putative hydrolase of the HAD superfamily